MATYAATGITLHVRKYKGTQRLVSFFTRERGKVEATLSGVGKPGSKLAPAAEPLTLSKLFFAEGRGLDRLIQCQVIESFYDLRKDLLRLGLGSYIAELVERTTEPGEPQPYLYDSFESAIAVLTTAKQPELVAWSFVLRHLEVHGVGPVIGVCVGCGDDLEGQSVYLAALGGCACRACDIAESDRLLVSPQARGALRSLAQMPHDRVDRLKLSPAVQGQIRDLLWRHIQYHMGVSLRSATFLRKMGSLGGAEG